MVLTCEKHNLPQNIICVGENCTRRIGCKLCIEKHDHKFYLQNRYKQKELQRVRQELNNKILTMKSYTLSNIKNLKLQQYQEQLLRVFQGEEHYLMSKISEEVVNFNILIEKCERLIKECLNRSKLLVINSWSQCNKEAQAYINTTDQFDQIIKYFKEGDWTTQEHIEKSINFIYSQELMFRFNRNLDNLKTKIKHYKNQNQKILNWFCDRRSKHKDFCFCPHDTFHNFINLYSPEPTITPYITPITKQTKDDQESILNLINQQQNITLISPKIIYQPFQNIYKLIRYDNDLFATTGSRTVNIWSKISIQPQKSYKLQFTSYGASIFQQKGKKDSDNKVIFGLSNGQMGMVDMQKDVVQIMPAHSSTIRDIIQYDSYHFLTASQDWLMKLWAINSKGQQKYFASQRLQLKGHSGKVHCMAKFGPYVLSGGSDETIKMWDIMKKSYQLVYIQEKELNCLMELRPEIFVSCGEINQIRIWDYRKSKLPVLKFGIDFYSQSMLKYDQNTIIFNDKHIIKIVDIRNLKQALTRFNNNTTYQKAINSMDFLSDSEIGMGGNDSIVSIWKY